ncbi:MAG: AMP-binding protein [Clostridia bacterium]|nr:AMP-binding protein [Clostridia bacterium]
MNKSIEAYYRERVKKPESLRSMLQATAAKFGGKPLFRFIASDNSVIEMTYSSFAYYVDALGTGLHALGCQGKRIAVISESRPEWMMTYIAAIQLGGVIVPLDKELLETGIRDFLNSSEAYVLVYSKALAPKIDQIKDQVNGVKYFVQMNEDCIYNSDTFCLPLSDCLSLTDIGFETVIALGSRNLQNCNNEFANIQSDLYKMSALIFTSGTTGTSKGVMLSENNILSCIYVSANRTSFTEKDELLSVLPWHHTYETCCGLLTPICLGMTVNINNSLKYVMKNLMRFKPTGLILVPLFVTNIYKKIMAEVKKKGREKDFQRGLKISSFAKKLGVDISSRVFSDITLALGGRLKKIICGGAPLDADMVERFGELGINLAQGYGITECAPLLSVNPYFNLKHGSVGPPVFERSIRIAIYDEDGRSYAYAPANTIGEVLYRGANLMIGYYNNDKANEDAFTDNGYFKTGDLGYLDEDGFLFLTGRKKNLIILANGKNVYPEELEEYIYKIDFIKECAVVAREHGGEPVITAIVFPDYSDPRLKGASDVTEIVKNEIAAINKKLPLFKQIRNIEIKKTEFEKSSTNKILRYKL